MTRIEYEGYHERRSEYMDYMSLCEEEEKRKLKIRNNIRNTVAVGAVGVLGALGVWAMGNFRRGRGRERR